MNRMTQHADAHPNETLADQAVDAVAENPGVAVGLAAAAGMVLGLMAAGMLSESRRPRGRGEQLQDFLAGVRDSVEDSVRSALRS